MVLYQSENIHKVVQPIDQEDCFLFTKINVLTFLFSITAAATAVLPNPGGAIKTE